MEGILNRYLAKAVQYHSEQRIFLNDNKTVTQIKGTKLKHYSTIGTNNKEAAENFTMNFCFEGKKFPANDV